jgi:hypothetical protein
VNELHANVLIRGYMQCHLKTETFAAHVASCVKRQLLEFDKKAEFEMDHHTNFFLFYGQAFERPFMSLLTLAEVEELKAEGPYALDRIIWCDIQKKGIPIEKTTHYLLTVLFKEK